MALTDPLPPHILALVSEQKLPSSSKSTSKVKTATAKAATSMDPAKTPKPSACAHSGCTSARNINQSCTNKCCPPHCKSDFGGCGVHRITGTSESVQLPHPVSPATMPPSRSSVMPPPNSHFSTTLSNHIQRRKHQQQQGPELSARQKEKLPEPLTRSEPVPPDAFESWFKTVNNTIQED